MMVPRDLYTSIIRLNAEAADAQAFEVAYHLLAAALHAAEPLNETDAFETVIRIAADQSAAVNKMKDHPMAAVNATRRGTTPLYEALITMAESKILQLKAHRVIKSHRPT